MKQPETIKVRITKDTRSWYKLDEIHEVGNYITFGYGVPKEQSCPHFEKGKGNHGILVSDCEVLNMEEPHTIQIDGKEIELSEESYQNIKKHFET